MGDFLGTLPQWLSAGALVTFIGLILRYDLGKRKIGSDAAADIRDHYAAEVAALRARIVEIEAHYRSLLQHSDEQHEACKEDRERLHQEVIGLRNEVDGLKRQIVRYSADRALLLDEEASPMVKDAARRAKDITE